MITWRRKTKSPGQSAGGNPGRFRERLPALYLVLTVMLALLAYVYILGFPVLALIYLGRAMFFATRLEWLDLAQSAFASAAFALIGYQLYQIRPQAPNHVPLPEPVAPKLFQMIEHVREQTRAPRLARVLIDDGMDVRMVYTPFNGYPFSYSHSLVIGFAAMQLLAPLHFKGLVARRLGQSSHRNNRLVSWLATLRYFGPALLKACPDWRGIDNIVVRVFFLWYAPLYQRCSVQVARMHEVYGDRYMMDLVNDRDVAELLTAQVIAENYLRERYMPAIMDLARKRPTPSPMFYSGIDRKFNRYWTSTDAKRWLQHEFATRPAANDPRPSLRRRLAEIGHSSPRLPSPLRQAASRVLLDVMLKPIIGKLDRAWARRVAKRWRATHEQAKKEVRRMGRLHKKSRAERLSPRESIELATLVERCHGPAKAEPFYRQLLKLHAGDAAANYAVGKFLAARQDERGLTALEKAMDLDARFASRAGKLIAAFHAERHRENEDSGEYPTISDTELPIVVSETRAAVTETGIRQAISEIGAHGAVTDIRLRKAITDPGVDSPAAAEEDDLKSGLHAAISETGLRGAAAIETGLREVVTQTGQPVLATEKAEPRAGSEAEPQRATESDDAPAAPPAAVTEKGLAELDVSEALARTASRSSVTAAGVQMAITDSAVRKAITGTTAALGKAAKTSKHSLA